MHFLFECNFFNQLTMLHWSPADHDIKEEIHSSRVYVRQKLDRMDAAYEKLVFNTETFDACRR